MDAHDAAFPMAAMNRIVQAAIADAAAQGAPKASVSRDAKDALNTSGVTFVNYITHLALEEAKKGKRTTVSAADVSAALTAGGFGDWVAGLEGDLEAMKAAKGAKKA